MVASRTYPRLYDVAAGRAWLQFEWTCLLRESQRRKSPRDPPGVSSELATAQPDPWQNCNRERFNALRASSAEPATWSNIQLPESRPLPGWPLPLRSSCGMVHVVSSAQVILTLFPSVGKGSFSSGIVIYHLPVSLDRRCSMSNAHVHTSNNKANNAGGYQVQWPIVRENSFDQLRHVEILF